MYNDNKRPARPWQARWWREDKERWRWAGTIAIVFALMGAFAYRNPQVWQPDTLPQIAEGDTAAQPESTRSADLLLEYIPESPHEEKILEAAEPPPAEELPATEVKPEPEGPEDEVVAVSAPPTTWQRPAGGSWTRGYGYGLDPTLGDYRFHNGCDMEMPDGSPVFAVAAGLVVHAADDAAWGGLVIIEHGGGWRSVYKCIHPAVQAGLEVFAGEPIGTVLPSPPTELAQPSHVHFEMEIDSKRQDPGQWI